MNEDNIPEENFADLFKEAAADRRTLKPGQKVSAKVVEITDEFIFLDVGGKSEGYLQKSELLDEEGNLSVAPGDILEAYFLTSENHEKMFTTRVGAGTISISHLEEAYRSDIPVEGYVGREIKGGFEVTVAGNIRAFCPYSQMELHRIEDPAAYIDRHLSFRIAEFGEQGRNIILSRRRLLEDERQQQKEQLRQTLETGMTVRGTVTSIRNFGAFVDIGGLEGLVPVSEIGWGRVDDIHDHLQVGQEVEVVVLKLDWESDRFSFSLKEALPDPWRGIADKYPVGSVHTGTVARLAKFGAFVTLEPGIDGLVHISSLGGGRRLNHPREAVEEGRELAVRIESVDPENRRLSLVPAGGPEEEHDETEEQTFRDYTKRGTSRRKPAMGTLGALLEAKLKEKKKS